MADAHAGMTTPPALAAPKALVSRAATAWGALLVLTAIGAYVRLANLGALGFRWDEKYSSLAVKGILEHGIPELPSGMVYLRGGWLSYLMAASAQLLGHDELALRLPVALFGVAIIPAAFLLGRALFGVPVGLLTAALVAFSAWDVELARYARMYAPFAFFYVLTILAVWRYRVERESFAGGLLCIALALVAVSLHQLAYTLAAAFLFPVVLRGRILDEPARLVFPLAAAGTVAAAFLGWSGALGHFRELPAAAAAAAAAADPAAAAESAGIVQVAVQSLLGPLASALPDLPLVAALWQRAPALLVAFAVTAAAGVLLFLRRPAGAAQGGRPLDVALLAAIAVCAVLQLFNVALLALALLAFRKRAGLEALRVPDVRMGLAIVVIGFAAWLAAGLAFDLAGLAREGAARAVAGTMRAMLDFPHFFVFWGFANEWPLAAVPAALGALWAFDRAARPGPDPAAAFLLLTLGTILVCNGLFDTLYEIFRYNVPFSTFFFVFAALGVLRWCALLERVRRPSHRVLLLGTFALAALPFAYDVNPLRAFLITERGYRNDGALYRWFGLESYPDYQGPAAFVRAAAGPDDLIIAFDSREYYDYVGRLDYWLRSSGYESQSYEEDGRIRDLYLATPLVADLPTLESVLRLPDRTKWIVAADWLLEDAAPLSEDIKRFLRGHRDRVVYVGRDGATRVYRFGPSGMRWSDSASGSIGRQ
ncbi:MAG TPA: glycosyltransferase family 39 protein [Gammaproteobacteria bacterium]